MVYDNHWVKVIDKGEYAVGMVAVNNERDKVTGMVMNS